MRLADAQAVKCGCHVCLTQETLSASVTVLVQNTIPKRTTSRCYILRIIHHCSASQVYIVCRCILEKWSLKRGGRKGKFDCIVNRSFCIFTKLLKKVSFA